MVRWIKLKEFDLSASALIEASDEYVAGCDDSFRREAFRLHTDEAGFMRSSEPAFEEDRIILLGDSSAESLFIQEDRRLGAVIEGRLRAAGRRVDVLMGAMSNCTTLHALNIFVNKCIPLRPSQLIYMSCGSDAEVLCWESEYWLNDPGKLLGPIAQHAPGKSENLSDMPNSGGRSAMLRVLREAATSHGTELVLVTVPHRRRIDPFLTQKYSGDFQYHNRITAMKHTINECTRRFAEEYSLHCVDAELVSDDGNLFYDIVHLNGHGCEVVGGMIAECLIKFGKTARNPSREGV